MPQRVLCYDSSNSVGITEIAREKVREFHIQVSVGAQVRLFLTNTREDETDLFERLTAGDSKIVCIL